jgi:predicted small secreted protein
MNLKKNTILVIILAVSFIAFSSGLTILAIKADENNKANKVEQVVLEDSNALNTNQQTPDGSITETHTENKDGNASSSDYNSLSGNRAEAEAENSDDNAAAADPGEASDNGKLKEKKSNYKITVEDGTDNSDCNISYEQAVSLGLKSIEKKTGIDCSYAAVKVSRYDTNESVTWNCVAEDGKYRFEFRVNANSGKILSSNQYELENGSDYVWILKSNGNTVEKKIDQQKIQAYKSLTIKADSNMNIEVQEGKCYSINAKYYGEDYQVSYKIENGTLQIEAEGYSGSEDNASNTLTLTIPEDVSLKTVNLSLEYGNFTMEKVSADDIDISLESGTLTMNEVTSGDSTLTIGTGNAELTNYFSDKNSIDIAAGNIQMDNCTSNVCKITLDIGDAKLKGKLTGHTECTAAMGSVEIHCTGAAQNYTYMLKTDLGKVSVDGKDSIKKLSSNNNDANSINVSTGMGMAALDFE